MTFKFNALTPEPEYIDLTEYLQDIEAIEEFDCEDCPLEHATPIQGEGQKKILIVMSHPTKGDTQFGNLSHSHTYNMLNNQLSNLGINLHRDCWVTTAVNCYPNNIVPSKKMFQNCRYRLYQEVMQLKPKLVLLAGRNATHGWLGHIYNVTPRIPDYRGYKYDEEYEMWVGHVIPDQQYSFVVDGQEVVPNVIPLFNTHDISKSYDKNRKGQGTQSVLYNKHLGILKMATKVLELGYGKKLAPLDSYVTKVTSEQEAIQILHNLNVPSILAFDYETTGLKPYNAGHRIVMVGLCNGKETYAIPFFDHNQAFLDAFKALMINPQVKKVCQNLKFEYNWTRAVLGYEMQGVSWDTMLATHILDMRDGLTSLKVQSYLQFGIAGYEKEIKKLLISTEKNKGANGVNLLRYLYPTHLHMNNIVWDKLLTYVGSDAKLTYDLYVRQRQLFISMDHKHLLKGMKLFMESTLSLAEMEYNGFRFDYEQLKENKLAIKEQLKELKVTMLGTKEYQKWKLKYPDKPLNTNSPKQLQEFLFDILKLPVIKYTDSGSPSTDKDSLTQLDSEYARLLLDYKALDKMLNSFLTGYENEANTDGYLRCFYHMNRVKSYRTSSSDVNLQNVSQHYEISQYALNLLKPREGHLMLSADFKSLEVYCAAAHTRDPKLIEYLHDESTDMHRDVACDIHFYEATELPKRLRTLAKKFVFGAFYGAGYRSIAYNQWQGMIAEDKDRLKSYNIINYDTFEFHIKKIFDYFWNTRFRQYTEWKKRQWAFYVKYGYFIGHTGFMYTGVCNIRQVSNFGIQGDASHLLLQEANFMYKYIRDNNLQSRLIGQVHDSLLISVPPEEVVIITSAMQLFLSELVPNNLWAKGLDFAIEVEASEVDGHWGKMKEIALIRADRVQQLGA